MHGPGDLIMTNKQNKQRKEKKQLKEDYEHPHPISFYLHHDDKFS